MPPSARRPAAYHAGQASRRFIIFCVKRRHDVSFAAGLAGHEAQRAGQQVHADAPLDTNATAKLLTYRHCWCVKVTATVALPSPKIHDIDFD